jgi:hypothetical protein
MANCGDMTSGGKRWIVVGSVRVGAKMSVQLTALSRANGDFPSRGWKILIGQLNE